MSAVFTKPDAITIPFCNTGDLVAPPSTSGTVASQELGYPPVQGQPLPPAGSGLPVNRLQTNGVINLYSQFALWNSVGGQWTFDAAIATAGGYNAGAVLYDFETNSYQVSLIDENTNNFVTTRSYLNDRINWLQITNPTECNFNFVRNLAAIEPHTVSLSDGFCLLNSGTDSSIIFPNPDGAFPPGFSVAIINFNSGSTVDVTLTDESDATFEFTLQEDKVIHIVTTDGLNGWWVDNQYQSYAAPLINYGVYSPPLIQTGSFSGSATSNTLDVTYGTAFPNGTSFVQITGIGFGGGAVDGGNPIEVNGSPTASGFQVGAITSTDVDNISGTYIAFGY